MPSSCRHTSANFAKSAGYFLLNCHGPGVPVYYLRNSLNDTDGKNQSTDSFQSVYAIISRVL